MTSNSTSIEAVSKARDCRVATSPLSSAVRALETLLSMFDNSCWDWEKMSMVVGVWGLG